MDIYSLTYRVWEENSNSRYTVQGPFCKMYLRFKKKIYTTKSKLAIYSSNSYNISCFFCQVPHTIMYSVKDYC